MNIVKKLISNNFSKGRSRPIIQITPHTAVTGASSLFGWFNNPAAQASTHAYVNAQGIIEQYVEDGNTAWANSNWNANSQALTFETWDNNNPNDSVRTDALYESSAQLMAYWAKKYNIPLVLLTKEQALANQPGISLHKYYANKSCPAGLNVQRIIDRAKIINDTPMNDFNYEIYLKDNSNGGKDMYMKVLIGSINEKITVTNKDTGWVGNPFCNKSPGNDGNAINTNIGPNLYEINAKGVVKTFDNRPVVDPCADRVKPLEEKIKTLESQNTTLKNENTDLKNKITSLESEVAVLKTDLASFVPTTFYVKK